MWTVGRRKYRIDERQVSRPLTPLSEAQMMMSRNCGGDRKQERWDEFKDERQVCGITRTHVGVVTGTQDSG